MGTHRLTKAVLLLAFYSIMASGSIIVRPGHCPSVFQPFVPAKPCVHDGNCNEGEKCCVYYGKPVCAPALLRCPSTDGLVGSCVELCSSASDCSDNQMCCSNGCGHECMSTVPVKPGSCSSPLYTPWCYKFCDNDSDCPGKKKCCLTTCGRVCKLP